MTGSVVTSAPSIVIIQAATATLYITSATPGGMAMTTTSDLTTSATITFYRTMMGTTTRTMTGMVRTKITTIVPASAVATSAVTTTTSIARISETFGIVSI